VVPEQLSVGDTFLVKFDAEAAADDNGNLSRTPSLVDVLDGLLTPKPDDDKTKIVVDSKVMPQAEERDAATHAITEDQKDDANTTEDQKDESRDQELEAAPRQKLLLVQVPPGLPVGTTIHVEIPGEFRTVAAKVPPDVSSFHVFYTPQQMPPPSSNMRTLAPELPLPTRSSPPQQASSTVISSKKGPKLLRVRIPPGTGPGTVLHVSVPDEPGRILAATVPQGARHEFHVSYEAKTQMQPRSLLPPSPYRAAEPPAAEMPRHVYQRRQILE